MSNIINLIASQGVSIETIYLILALPFIATLAFLLILTGSATCAMGLGPLSWLVPAAQDKRPASRKMATIETPIVLFIVTSFSLGVKG